jgi:hypothetical protein
MLLAAAWQNLGRNWHCQSTFLHVAVGANSTTSTATVSAVHASLPAKRTNVRSVAFPSFPLLLKIHFKY